MSEARDEILTRIRAGLRGVTASDGGASALPEMAPIDAASFGIATFTERAKAAGAQVYDVPAGEDYGTVVGEILASLDAAKIAVSSDPIAREVCMNFGCATVSGDVSKEALFGCAAGVTCVQAAIAETGSLVLRTDEERHRLTSLVPDVHVALVRRDQVVATLDDALAGIDSDAIPRCVTFITGPSRTADIELELVVGVHGPRELHIVLFEED